MLVQHLSDHLFIVIITNDFLAILKERIWLGTIPEAETVHKLIRRSGFKPKLVSLSNWWEDQDQRWRELDNFNKLAED